MYLDWEITEPITTKCPNCGKEIKHIFSCNIEDDFEGISHCVVRESLVLCDNCHHLINFIPEDVKIMITDFNTKIVDNPKPCFTVGKEYFVKPSRKICKLEEIVTIFNTVNVYKFSDNENYIMYLDVYKLKGTEYEGLYKVLCSNDIIPM